MARSKKPTTKPPVPLNNDSDDDVIPDDLPEVLPNLPSSKEARIQHLLYWMPKIAPVQMMKNYVPTGPYLRRMTMAQLKTMNDGVEKDLKSHWTFVNAETQLENSRKKKNNNKQNDDAISEGSLPLSDVMKRKRKSPPKESSKMKMHIVVRDGKARAVTNARDKDKIRLTMAVMLRM